MTGQFWPSDWVVKYRDSEDHTMQTWCLALNSQTARTIATALNVTDSFRGQFVAKNIRTGEEL